MGVLFIAFVLVCGYTYTSNYPPATYRQNRANGWNLYFFVAVWGFNFLLAGAATVLILDFFNIPSHVLHWMGLNPDVISAKFDSYSHDQITTYEIAAGFIALFFSFFVSRLQRSLMANSPWFANKLLELYSADPFEYLLFESLIEGYMVSLTLDTRKCYIGVVDSMEPDEGPMSSVSIIPMFSGYRCEEKLEFNFVRNYSEHFEAAGLFEDDADFAELLKYKIAIPVSRIAHVSFFDISVYEQLSSDHDE